MARVLDQVLADWSRLGMEINVSPSHNAPDAEILLVESARLLPDFARMLPISVTWVSRCERLIAKRRLAQLAASVANAEHSACLGLILAFARGYTRTEHLAQAIGECRPLTPAIAMLRAERASTYRRVVECEAHALSRQWGILAPQPDLKNDAIRPVTWILEHNPRLRLQAILNGGLRASLIAEIGAHPDSGRSESAMARALGATRKAVREALGSLEFCGLITRTLHGREVRITLNSHAHVW